MLLYFLNLRATWSEGVKDFENNIVQATLNYLNEILDKLKDSSFIKSFNLREHNAGFFLSNGYSNDLSFFLVWRQMKTLVFAITINHFWKIQVDDL
jgi:hypothetical protein